MSMDLKNPEQQKPKKHRRSELEKSDKKRRRKTTEDLEPSSPTKKRKSKPPKDSPTSSVLKQPPGPSLSPQTSPFYERTISLYLPIAPIAQLHPLSAVCAEHLSPLLLTYYPPFHGVLLSYSNPHLSSNPHDITTTNGRQKAFARSVDEYAASFVWLTAEFLVFRPGVGDVIEGFVNLQSENSIGIVYWNFFNASIERRFLPREWKWVPGGMSARMKLKKAKRGKAESVDEVEEVEEVEEDEKVPETILEDDVGHFTDGDGRRVEGQIRFYVRNVETSRSADRENGFLGVGGTMLGLAGENSTVPGGHWTNGSIFGGHAR